MKRLLCVAVLTAFFASFGWCSVNAAAVKTTLIPYSDFDDSSQYDLTNVGTPKSVWSQSTSGLVTFKDDAAGGQYGEISGAADTKFYRTFDNAVPASLATGDSVLMKARMNLAPVSAAPASGAGGNISFMFMKADNTDQTNYGVTAMRIARRPDSGGAVYQADFSGDFNGRQGYYGNADVDAWHDMLIVYTVESTTSNATMKQYLDGALVQTKTGNTAFMPRFLGDGGAAFRIAVLASTARFDDAEIYLVTGGSLPFEPTLTSATSNVPLTEPIKISFSTEIYKAAFTAGTVKINGENVDSSRISVGQDQKSVSIAPPTLGWEGSTSYSVEIANTLKDVFGTAATASTLNFETVVTPFNISNFNGGVVQDIAVAGNLTVAFSKEFSVAQLSGNVKLQKTGYASKVVPDAAFALGGDDKTLTIDLSQLALDNGQSYTLSFDNSITNTISEQLEGVTSFIFTTEVDENATTQTDLVPFTDFEDATTPLWTKTNSGNAFIDDGVQIEFGSNHAYKVRFDAGTETNSGSMLQLAYPAYATSPVPDQVEINAKLKIETPTGQDMKVQLQLANNASSRFRMVQILAKTDGSQVAAAANGTVSDTNFNSSKDFAAHTSGWLDVRAVLQIDKSGSPINYTIYLNGSEHSTGSYTAANWSDLNVLRVAVFPGATGNNAVTVYLDDVGMAAVTSNVVVLTPQETLVDTVNTAANLAELTEILENGWGLLNLTDNDLQGLSLSEIYGAVLSQQGNFEVVSDIADFIKEYAAATVVLAAFNDSEVSEITEDILATLGVSESFASVLENVNSTARASVLASVSGQEFASLSELAAAVKTATVLYGLMGYEGLGTSVADDVLALAKADSDVSADFSQFDKLTATQKVAAKAFMLSASGYTDLQSLIDAAVAEGKKTSADSSTSGNTSKNNAGSTGGGVSAGGAVVANAGNTLPLSTEDLYDYVTGGTEVERIANITAFTDLENYSWAQSAVKTLAANGVINGKSETSFEPEGNVTREEFVKMVVLALNLDSSDAVSNNFSDVDPTAWYAPYVAKAVQLGVINGISESQFGVARSITREDAAVILFRAATLTDIKLDMVVGDVAFADSQDIYPYAADAVKVLKKMSIISGFEDGSYRPKQTTTRAEAAVIIYNVYKLLGGVK